MSLHPRRVESTRPHPVDALTSALVEKHDLGLSDGAAGLYLLLLNRTGADGGDVDIVWGELLNARGYTSKRTIEGHLAELINFGLVTVLERRDGKWRLHIHSPATADKAQKIAPQPPTVTPTPPPHGSMDHGSMLNGSMGDGDALALLNGPMDGAQKIAPAPHPSDSTAAGDLGPALERLFERYLDGCSPASQASKRNELRDLILRRLAQLGENQLHEGIAGAIADATLEGGAAAMRKLLSALDETARKKAARAINNPGGFFQWKLKDLGLKYHARAPPR